MKNLEVKTIDREKIEHGEKYSIKVYTDYTDDFSKLLTKNYICLKDEIMENKSAIAIAVDNSILMVKIENYFTSSQNISILFNELEYYGVNICMMSQNNNINNGKIEFLLPISNEDLLDIVLKKIIVNFPEIKIFKKKNMSKVSLIGIGMGSNLGVTSKILKILGDKNLKSYNLTISEISVTLVIDREAKDIYIRKLVELF